MKVVYFRLAFTAVLLGVLIFVVSRTFKIEDLKAVVFDFPKDQLLILIVISVLISVLKAWRFLVILRNSNIKVSFLNNLKAFMASQAISPLPGGESMRGILIHKETGTELRNTTGPVITQAYLELLSGAILAVIGSFYFKFLRIPLLAFLGVLIIFAVILSHERILKFLHFKLIRIRFLSKLTDTLLDTQKNIRSHLIDEETHLPDKVLVRALGLSLLSNIMGGVLLLVIASAYGVSINIFQATFLNSASIIIQTLSVFSPGGLGFTEGGMTGILLTYKVPIAQGLAVVLLYRLMTLFLNVVIGLILLIIFYSRLLILRKN